MTTRGVLIFALLHSEFQLIGDRRAVGMDARKGFPMAGRDWKSPVSMICRMAASHFPRPS